MYLLTQLSIFDAVQNLKQIRLTENIFERRKFSATTIAQASANKKHDLKVFLYFLIFPGKTA